LAKITLIYTEDDEDGIQHTQSTIITRDKVDDLQDVCTFLMDAINSVGYTYVEGVTVHKSSGDEVRSYF